MASMKIRLSLILEGLFVNQEQLEPNEFAFPLSGDGLRRTVTLSHNAQTTLDSGEMSSDDRLFFFMNIHPENDLVITFESAPLITLKPGHVNLISTKKNPSAKGMGGDSRLLYGVYA